MNHCVVWFEFVLFLCLEDLEEQATMGGEERSEHERLHGHELDENVE